MTRFRWIMPVIALVALAVGSYWYASEPFEAQAQQETGTCPNARLIDEFTGTGSQETDTFNTTTNSFRITYELRARGDTTGGGALEPSLLISVNRRDGLPVSSASQDGPGTGDSFVNEPAGNYFLRITSIGNAEYTERVEQCEGGTPSTNPQAGQPKTRPSQPKDQPQAAAPKQQPKGQSRQQPAPPPRPTPSPPEPSFNPGGPSQGPVPLMPNGNCPNEFPVKQGKACYQ